LSKTLFSSWPSFDEEECDAVRKVLLSNKVNYWTGDICRQFEQEFASWASTEYAVALANGSVALEIALRAIDVGPGDEVIVTPRTFIATVSSIVNVGAIPVFADVDIDSGNITAESIVKVSTNKTKAIVCVHVAGWPCEMDSIMVLAEERDLYVIEDCAQAHGAKYKGQSVGSIGHIGCWSFCQDKIITTGGEGGMVTTNDRELWSKMWSYKDHGKSWQAVYESDHPPGFQWVHESFGTNWRMTEMQAAIGRIQLQKMANWHAARNKNANTILDVCEKFSEFLRLPRPTEGIGHAWYKCHIYVRPEKLKANWTREKIIEEINLNGIPCYAGSCSEVYLEKAFDVTEFRPKNRLPVAKELGETSLMFLVHPTLTEMEIDKTCKEIARLVTLIANE
jgi:dTDP-4-amino-4,6-dideoxygalactose transaminase